MGTCETHSRRVVFDQPPWLRVEYHEVELPGGRVIPDRSWITTPDYVNVVVETDLGQYLCFRQRKYAYPDPKLAIIGGYFETGESPLASAQCELREETGFVSDEWVELGHFLVDPNRGIAHGHLFLARKSRQEYDISSDDLEEKVIVLLNREELESALDGGEFKILAWAAAVDFALRYTAQD